MAWRRMPVVAALMTAVVLGVWLYMAVTRVAGTNVHPRFAIPLLPVTVLFWTGAFADDAGFGSGAASSRAAACR